MKPHLNLFLGRWFCTHVYNKVVITGIGGTMLEAWNDLQRKIALIDHMVE